MHIDQCLPTEKKFYYNFSRRNQANFAMIKKLKWIFQLVKTLHCILSVYVIRDRIKIFKLSEEKNVAKNLGSH